MRACSLGQDKMQRAFDAFDTDKSGHLDLQEFQKAIESLNLELTQRQFLELVTEVDADASGQISKEEFEVAMEKLSADLTEVAGRKDHIKIVLTFCIAWIVVGSIIFCGIEEWSGIESVYFAFVTLTTVGLGDVFPNSQKGQVFLVFFCLIGLGSLAVLFELLQRLMDDINEKKRQLQEKARNAAVKRRKIKFDRMGRVMSRGKKLMGRVSRRASSFRGPRGRAATEGNSTSAAPLNNTARKKLSFFAKAPNKPIRRQNDDSHSSGRKSLKSMNTSMLEVTYDSNVMNPLELLATSIVDADEEDTTCDHVDNPMRCVGKIGTGVDVV